jgi:hypothetical protein
MDLHGYYAFVDIQKNPISGSAEYIGKEYPPIQPDRQNQREKNYWEMDLHGYFVLVDILVDCISNSAEYIGMEYLIQPDRQNQGERIPRGVDLHGYIVLVDIQVDSISDSEEYIGKEGSAPYSQPDKTTEKEFPERWTFTAITSS